jgi:methanethiol S-methyltransferase
MISIICLIVMLFSMLVFGGLYVYSVLPAHLEAKIGEKAYKQCGIVRKISFVFLFVFTAAEICYVFFPITSAIPRYFFPGWYWLLSVFIGVIISVPATMIMKAATDAAKNESYSPQKANTMYGGIYNYIRHPQMIGDLLYWFVVVFFLNSPFLLLINLLWIPINIVMMLAEEKDLELRYGEVYLNYKKRTARFFPKVYKRNNS